MKPCAGILAEIFAVMALALAVPVKADGIFTMRMGYNNYPVYGGYYNYWPDNQWYGYWPSFYYPVFFDNYYPFYYNFYPSYYYPFYYRPVVPFYQTYRCYPWYSCPYYHHEHDRDHFDHRHHDRHYSLEPYKRHDAHEQNRTNLHEADTHERNRQYRGSREDNRTSAASFRGSPASTQEANNSTINNTGREKPDVAREDKNIKILYMKKAGAAPVVSSTPMPGTVRIISNTTTANPAQAVPARRNNFTTVNPSTPEKRYANLKQPSPQPSFAGGDRANRTSSFGRPAREAVMVTPQQPSVTLPGKRPERVQARGDQRRDRGRDARQADGDNSPGSRTSRNQGYARE